MKLVYILSSILALLLVLHLAFPDAILPQDVHLHILYAVMLLLLVGSGITLQRTHARENIRNAGIWLAIMAGLALAYQLLANLSGSDSLGGRYF